jgi:homoserine kinase
VGWVAALRQSWAGSNWLVSCAKRIFLISRYKITRLSLKDILTTSALRCTADIVLSCVAVDRNVLSVRFDWPAKIRTVVVSPHTQLPTHVARTALPRTLSRVDAVFNLQRTSLFTAALVTRRFELFKEAMRDRLHQARRESLVPGLAEALALPEMSGLLGVALSGAGPSIIALVSGNEDEVRSAYLRVFCSAQDQVNRSHT